MASTPKSELFSPTPTRREGPTSGFGARPSGWSSTQANALEQSLLATRLLGADERARDTRGDVGHSAFPGRYEIFSPSAPAAALQEQFQSLRPEFIALHELGTAWSRKFLRGMAAATGRLPKTLDVRREGSGAVLASIEYVECPTTHGGTLRIYSTDLPGQALDDETRQQVCHVLLAHARLSVVVLGDLGMNPRAPFGPLYHAMTQGPWPNRHMLLMPLTSGSMLGTIATDLSDETGVSVRTTPQVVRNADAWSFISGTWNHLRDELARRGGGFGGAGVVLPALPGAKQTARTSSVDSRHVALESMRGELGPAETTDPPRLHEAAAASTRTTAFNAASAPDRSHARERLLEQVSSLPGLVLCALVDRTGGPGDGPLSLLRGPAFTATLPSTAEAWADAARHWLGGIDAEAHALGIQGRAQGARIDLAGWHVFLRPLAASSLTLLAVFDQSEQAMKYELQLRRLESEQIGG